MTRLQSFNIDTTLSGTDLNVNGGITLKGTYTTNDLSGSMNNYQVYYSTNGGRTFSSISRDSVTFNSDGTFTISIGNQSGSGDAGDLDGKNVIFQLRQDNPGWNNDVTVTEQGSTPIGIYCFYPGTMIATPAGEKAVETLSIGDEVLKHDGSVSLVRWMGRNTVASFFAARANSLPIRIRKDAFAASVPSRDLLVSPDHAMFVDGILAQAGALMNGTSIVRENQVPATFTYHHIELAEHALIVAENAPTESFIDNVDRMAYDNWAEHEALYGDLPALVELDLPRAKSQRQVPSVTRKRLADRAVELGYATVDAAVA